MGVDVSSICLSYGESVILKDISFQVVPGEILALVGPNGSGKSSLLDIMSGNKRPSAGLVKYNGIPLENISIMERSTLRAVMGQNAPVVYDFTVSDVLEMGWLGRNLSKSNDGEFQNCLNDIAKECKLDSFLSRKFNTLSGGEQRRVHFARSLIQLKNSFNSNKPKFLFLDEPTANMDIYWELQMLESAKKIAKKGLGVLLIIHDINLALKFADKIALISKGMIKKISKPETFFDERLFSIVYGLEMSFNRKLMKIFYF